ncbi:hypothetical protein BZARG_1049 [Bizionia argentinensis JUB59]|uniref:Uncharacterized protein n=1 Tax=Bizionia argentinensis JUB59 TaxID=1046627 RepID=G2EEE9_9FLAO|nr:hypothetical protein [Bizionia argentinensis]EGV43104.1 hypothetical protein BZARG_1049 [Bizionia argentinensis JUB59]
MGCKKIIIYPNNKEVDYGDDNDLRVAEFKDVISGMEEQIKRMQSRVPQGVSVSETKITRTGIEKDYEWEK